MSAGAHCAGAERFELPRLTLPRPTIRPLICRSSPDALLGDVVFKTISKKRRLSFFYALSLYYYYYNLLLFTLCRTKIDTYTFVFLYVQH